MPINAGWLVETMLFGEVARKRGGSGDAILLTSRFRSMDRQENADTLISFERSPKRPQVASRADLR
jgi:hypothetical protein